MENIVYYFLIVFGAVLVWISCNDLRKLKENNAQWAEIEQQSHLYNQDNYAEAEKLVKKLQKIIPFLSKFALLNGVFAIIGSLLGLVGLFNAISFNLYTLGCWSVFLLFITSAFFIGLHRHSEQDEFFYHLNKRYKKSIYFFMENNTINFSKYIGSTAG
ncbi:MAG: hypothetical protein IKI11_09090, partial [Neisseriaceae bacterium]|nr:hypothetical protein [Neisseriaceae bacterium]